VGSLSHAQARNASTCLYGRVHMYEAARVHVSKPARCVKTGHEVNLSRGM
jgi:hypothetical protein